MNDDDQEHPIPANQPTPGMYPILPTLAKALAEAKRSQRLRCAGCRRSGKKIDFVGRTHRRGWLCHDCAKAADLERKAKR